MMITQQVVKTTLQHQDALILPDIFVFLCDILLLSGIINDDKSMATCVPQRCYHSNRAI